MISASKTNMKKLVEDNASEILGAHRKTGTYYNTPDENEEKAITMVVMEAMMKEKQKAKRNVRDRIPGKLIREFFKFIVGPGTEKALVDFTMMAIGNFGLDYMNQTSAEFHEIRQLREYKIRVLEAWRERGLNMKTSEAEVPLTAHRSLFWGIINGSPLFIISICLLTVFSAVFFQDFLKSLL